MTGRRRVALIVLCLGALLIVLDLTIVNVALPSLASDLGFSESSLTWVLNAYLLVYGGFLLLAGRLGDLYAQRRLYLGGLALFGAASLACGLAPSAGWLVGARAVQGLGAAVVDALSLTLIVSLFPEPCERAKAMGVYGFVNAGGGTLGVALGGILTSAFSWHAVFLVAVPAAAAAFALTLWAVDGKKPGAARGRLDVAGAVLVTAAMLAAVSAVIGAEGAGWTSLRTLGLGALAVALFAAFVAVESRVGSPLVPLGIFRSRNLAAANAVALLWSAGMFAEMTITGLFLQRVAQWSPLEVGLAFLPGSAVMAACSIVLSARLVERFGVTAPMVAGLLLSAAGLALLVRLPLDPSALRDVVPGTVLVGIGGGIAFNPMLLAAIAEMKEEDAGLASGLVNTSFMMGGALALAVLAAIAATASGARPGVEVAREALAHGDRMALAGGAVAAVLGAAVAAAFVRRSGRRPARR